MATKYYQCNTCGAPNISDSKCEYCNSIYNQNEKFIHTNTDKNKFDLAIYELREGRTEEAKNIFDSILIKDSNNKLAILYKCIVEISWSNDLNKISRRLTDLNFYRIDSSLANDLLESLEHCLSLNHAILCESFILFIEKLPINSRIMFLETMLKRYSKDLAIAGQILKELEILLSHKELLLLDKDITGKLINRIKERFIDNLEFKEKFIYDKAKFILKYRTSDNEPLEENNWLIAYINEEHKFIKFLKTCTFLKEISEIEFEKYIEKCEIYDEKIRNPNFEIKIESKKPNACFIATATMGSYDHPVVIDLRNFRDDWLLKRNWGVVFTNWYYIYGYKAAKFIDKSFLLKKLAYYLVVKPLHLITRYFK